MASPPPAADQKSHIVANKIKGLNEKSIDGGNSTALDNHVIIEEDVEDAATYRSKARKSLKKSNFGSAADDRVKE